MVRRWSCVRKGKLMSVGSLLRYRPSPTIPKLTGGTSRDMTVAGSEERHAETAERGECDRRVAVIVLLLGLGSVMCGRVRWMDGVV